MKEFYDVLSLHKCVNIRIDLKKDLPMTVVGKKLDKKNIKVNLSEVVNAEDLRSLMHSIGELTSGNIAVLRSHCRVLPYNDWYLVCCDLFHEGLKKKPYLLGTIMDVSEYLGTVDEDPVLREYKEKNANKYIKIDPAIFSVILDVDYLRKIQLPFTYTEGVRSAIFTDADVFICSDDKNETSFTAKDFKAVKRNDIRITHTSAAYWIIASDDPELLDRYAPLHDTLTETVSKRANSFVMLHNEMVDSERANKLLSENIEQQILLNNMYNKILNEKNSFKTLNDIVKEVGEYMNLDRIVVCEDLPDEARYQTICEWTPDETDNIEIKGFNYGDYPKLEEELSYYETYFSNNTSHVVLGHEFSSYIASNLTGDGVRYGIIIYEIVDPQHILKNSEKRLLRNISQITATVLMRCKDNDELDTYYEELRYLAFNDPVLEIKNKTALDLDLENELRNDSSGVTVALKITNIKNLNHLLGYEYTDILLKQVTEYVNGMSAYNAAIYRYSDNVFIILLKNSAAEKARDFCEKLIARFREPWVYNESEHYFEISMGAAPYPAAGEKSTDIYRTTLMSMYKATEFGANSYAFFTEDFEKPIDEEYKQAQALRDAIENGMEDFFVRYQPIVSFDDGNLIGCEAFIGYKGRESETLIPLKLVKLAESLGLDLTIDEWLIDKACAFCKKMRDEINPDFKLSVNATPREMKTRAIISMAEQALMNNSLPPEALIIEIAESIITSHYNAVSPVMGGLKKLGVSVFIDSYGREHAVPSLLKHSCADAVKADLTFFTGVYDEFDKIMLNAFIGLTREAGTAVCVKKIESEGQLEALAEYGIKYAQGFFYATPLKEEEFAELAADWGKERQNKQYER